MHIHQHVPEGRRGPPARRRVGGGAGVQRRPRAVCAVVVAARET